MGLLPGFVFELWSYGKKGSILQMCMLKPTKNIDTFGTQTGETERSLLIALSLLNVIN